MQHLPHEKQMSIMKMGPLGSLWAPLGGALGGLLGLLGVSWELLGGLLGRSWSLVGASGGLLGGSWGPLGSLLGASGRFRRSCLNKGYDSLS